MKRIIAALVIFCAGLTAHADSLTNACIAAGADGATTAVGLANGMVEGNPLAPSSMPGIIAFAAAKCGAAVYIDRNFAEPSRTERLNALDAVWGAAAVSNVMILVTHSNPAGLVAGVAYGLYRWSETSDEREYAAFCADWAAQKTGNVCRPFARQ